MPEVTMNQQVYCLLRECANSRAKRELVLFWGMHPDDEFDSATLSYALDCGRTDAQQALHALVEAGLVDARVSDEKILYSLTTNRERRQVVVELATPGWERWQNMPGLLQEGCSSGI